MHNLTAEILSVGTELLMGQILDTNAQYISQRLAEVGINQYYRTTVGDNRQRLQETIQQALGRADLVILTGGLGPTEDDLTKETAAAVLGHTDFTIDETSKARMYQRFVHYNHAMPENNLKQVMFPKGAIILTNDYGTAPGCIIEKEGKAIILLPGPPREMRPMFDASVMPYLRRESHSQLYSQVLRVYGMGESMVAEQLGDLIDQQTNPTIATYALTGETTIRVTARCNSDREGEELLRPMIRQIQDRLGSVVYATHGEPLERVCAGLLEQAGKTLAVAESCSGGMLASTLVSVAGSSAWFLEGCVTYSNAAKMRRLGVREDTLASHGAVSRETALEMARGMRASAGADLALATTGIAGPGGGTAEKPVGLVYVALCGEAGEYVHEMHFAGDRERIRGAAVLEGLDMLRRYLTGMLEA